MALGFEPDLSEAEGCHKCHFFSGALPLREGFRDSDVNLEPFVKTSICGGYHDGVGYIGYRAVDI